MKSCIINTLCGLAAFLLLLVWAEPSSACIEKPKSLTLSDTTFDGKVEIGVGSNCRASVMIEDHRWLRIISRDGVNNELCVKVSSSNRDLDINRKYCGAQLTKANEGSLKEDLVLRDKEGVAIGQLVIENDILRIMSYNGGNVDSTKPFIEVVPRTNKLFQIAAYQSEGDQIGSFPVESKGCTRAFGGTAGKGVVDLRNKHITMDKAGCSGGMVVSQYSKSPRAKFRLGTNDMGSN